MPKSSLLVRLPNWIGDVIMCLPAIDLLQRHGITPILFGKPWIHELLQELKLPLYTWPRKLSDVKTLLKQFKESDMLLYPNSFSSAFDARWCGKKPIGYRIDGRSCLLSTRYSKPELDYEAAIFYHLSHVYLQTILKTKLNDDNPIIPQLPISKDCLESARQLLTAHNITSPYLLLCPFAHGMNRQKQPKKWPYWQQLCMALPKKSYIICPGPHEIEEAHHYFPDAIILEHIPLNIYAALCHYAKLVIANDSGPMHIAAAVGANTIALFGATDPQRSAPKNAEVLGKWQQWPNLEQVRNKIELLAL